MTTSYVGVELSSYIQVFSDVALSAQINGDGNIEIDFDRVVDLALTRDAAEKLHALIGEKLSELRSPTDGVD